MLITRKSRPQVLKKRKIGLKKKQKRFEVTAKAFNLWLRKKRQLARQKAVEEQTRYQRKHSPRKWLPRHQYINRKRAKKFIYEWRQEIWLERQQKWLRRNKRPFWKRKSFKRIRREQRLVEDSLMVIKKTYTPFSPVARHYALKKLVLKRYFRSNVAKRDFKNRITLRHYWKNRYGFNSHHKLQNFLSSIKKRANRLFSFFCKFELVLYRYARWWGLTPIHYPEEYAKMMVSHGYIYVNFKPEINPWYCVKKDDCIFAAASHRVMSFHMYQEWYTPKYGQVKFQSGRKEFIKARWYMRPPLYNLFMNRRSWRRRKRAHEWLEEATLGTDAFYHKLQSLMSASKWSSTALMHYFLLLEVSYKLKIVILMTGHNWFTLAFGATRVCYDLNIILVNKFVSSSYW